jgi:hypothetical protein
MHISVDSEKHNLICCYDYIFNEINAVLENIGILYWILNQTQDKNTWNNNKCSLCFRLNCEMNRENYRFQLNQVLLSSEFRTSAINIERLRIIVERVFSYQESKNESLKNTGFRYSRVRGKKLKMFCSKLWKKYRFDFFGAFGRSTAEILYRVQFEWRTSIQRKNTAEYSQPNGLWVVRFFVVLFVLICMARSILLF